MRLWDDNAFHFKTNKEDDPKNLLKFRSVVFIFICWEENLKGFVFFFAVVVVRTPNLRGHVP